ncbi:MAG: GAF domain-containing protein, partial [Candidatus Marithrix sp.]|nr:GAF domain-containing protein [Candidatus Marithrix sp.]
MSSKTSLNHKILLKVSIMITIIIILITFIGYSHIVSILESNTKIQLEKYIIERGHRESSIFQLAQDNLTLLKKEFYQQLETANSTEQQFAELFVKWPDGTTRNNLINNQTIAEFDTTKYPSVFLDKQIDINADIRQRVLIFYNLLQNYGPAWSNRFVDTYFLAPENIMVIYWPGEPWSLTASADLNIHNEEYFYISDKKHNPNRQQAWTGLYFDHVVKLWMVSVETPVDDKQGRHIATIGHDIVLNELMERTINDTLEGAYNLILRKDGRLIVEPNKIEAIKQKDGYFDILKSEDQQLINIFNSIKNIESGQIVIDNKTEFLAVTKIEGPDWYFVTVYPRTLLTEQAFATAGFIIILGIILLILVISVLYIVLRKQVTKPLHKFIFASQQIAAGNFATDSLPTKRSDELGQLANSLQDMTNQLDNSFKAKEAKNIMFSNIILDIVMVSEGLATGNLQVKPQSKYQDESVKIKTALETALTGLRHVIADIVKVSEGLATGNKIMPNADYPGDFSQIKEALETASSKLAQATAQNITQDWVKTGQAQLNELMRGEQDIVILTRNIITFLCEYVNSQVGLFYLLKKDEQQPYLQIVSSYAYTENNERPNKYLLGEGLVGQVALNKRVLAFSQTTEECPIIIRSGLANSMPYHLLLLPCLYENSVKGIIEIGTSKELSNIQHNFLEQVASNIAIAINT